MRDEQGRGTAAERATDPSAKIKKPYTKPFFREEPAFETMALTCGKLATQAQCQVHPMNS
jgi:hypothetical protein